MTDEIGTGYSVPDFSIEIENSGIEDELLALVNSVTVTKGIDQSDYICIEIKDMVENGEFKWLGNDVFALGNQLNVSMGFVDQLTYAAEAHIENISPDFSSGLAPTFTIEGSHKYFTQLKMATELKTYQQYTDSDIINDITSELSITAEVDDTSIQHEKKRKQGGVSYLSFIRTLVSQNQGYEFLVTEGTLYFRSAATTDSAAVTLTWGEDLETFNASVNLSDMVSDVTVRSGYLNATVEGTVSAGDETKMDSSLSSGSETATSVYGSNSVVISNHPVASEEEATEIAKAYLEASSANFVTAACSSVGMPDITPGICVELDGLGDQFSGTYYVTETTHTISGDAYQVNFKVRRNVL